MSLKPATLKIVSDTGAFQCSEIFESKFFMEHLRKTTSENVTENSLVKIFQSRMKISTYVMSCTLWYHLYNLETWKTPIEECYF